MVRFLLAASASALALGSPVYAGGQHGGGHGGGQHGAKGSSQKGGQAAHKSPGSGQGHGGGKAMKADRGGGQGHVMKVGRGPDKAGKAGHGNGQGNAMARGNGGSADRVLRADDGRVRVTDNIDYRTAAWGACPPGLAKKYNGCLPPGQAKKMVGAAIPALFANSVLEGPYRDWYRDDDRYYYRMGDDYIFRVDRGSNLVDGLFPYGFQDYAYYPVGMTYPSDYSYYNVPYQYRSYYPEGGDYLYRYGNGAIYGLDPQTQAVRSIVALLAGDLAVGQRLPAGYGVYNVPLSYRQQYYDTPDAWYRYNDGYIYRVDPTTQLVTAVINALV